MAAIVGTTRYEGVLSAGFSVAVPTGAQPNDVLLFAYRVQGSTATGYASGSGFTSVSPQGTQPDATHRVIGVLQRNLTSGDYANATVSFTPPGNTTTQRIAGLLLLVRPVTNATLVAVGSNTPYGGTLTTKTIASAAYSATIAGTPWTLVTAGAEFTASNSHLPSSGPAGLTLVDTVLHARSDETALATSRTAMSIYAGAVGAGARSVTFVGTPTAAAIQSITFDEVVTAPADPRTEVKVTSGSVVHSGRLSIVTADGIKPVTATIGLPWAGYTIVEMDADIAASRDVYWAHRGGSLDWSEMTMRAFTNAVWRGCRALEVSVRRSTDGVWIMSHDATLTRATGGASTATITATNSSAMLGLPVTVATTGGVIGRVEEPLEAWPEMLWIIDNKTGESAGDLFAIIQARIPDWQNRVIIKIDGAHGSSVFQTARNAGFKTAAYFYGDTTDAKINENMPYVDYPGMDHGALQARWDFIAAFGKPIWGHVLATMTEKNTAKTKGAKIFQCSGLKAIMPAVNNVG